MEVSLKDLIAPQFYSIHWDILEGKHTHYKLYGGRGSTKSSFVSIEIIYGMMQDPNANAACFRKVRTHWQRVYLGSSFGLLMPWRYLICGKSLFLH